MVEDRTSDGKRIAQLLASELTGLETGPLAAVEVTDPDRDAEPSPGGTQAYGVTFEGERVGTVVMYPERAVVDLSVGTGRSAPAGEGDGSGSGERLVVENGAAVKRAVDAVRERLGEASTSG